jgi:hypothetical protein
VQLLELHYSLLVGKHLPALVGLVAHLLAELNHVL